MVTKAPVKVLFLVDSIVTANAGTEGQLLKLLHKLDRKRIVPFLAVFRKSEYLESISDLCPIRDLEIGRLRTCHTLKQLVGLSSYIRKDQISIVHIFMNDAAIVAPLFCKLAGAKVIVSRRDMGFWYTRCTLALLRISKYFVDRVVANSQAVASLVQVKEGFPKHKTVIIRNGIEWDDVETASSNIDWRFWGIEEDDPVIAVVANLYPVKRHKDIIHAFVRVRAKFPTAQVVLVGEGLERMPLQQLTAQLGLGECIHFLGRRDDVTRILQRADVCVLSSESEGLSNAIIEYMFSGKPSVCARSGGTEELIDHGETGFLFNVGDVDALASHVVDLLSDPPLAVRLGRQAKEKAMAHFRLDHMLDAHIKLYNVLSRQKSIGMVFVWYAFVWHFYVLCY